MAVLFLMFIWSTLSIETSAFKPIIGHGDDPSMYTHESITLEGVERAAAKFLTTSGLFNTSTANPQDLIKEYFGADTHGYQDYQQRGRDFAAAVMEVYKTHHTNPDYTVNSERIAEADSLVKSTRQEIGSILSSGPLNDTSTNLLMDNVGKCLMIIQSFYSNTNWIEMMVRGGESFLNFGIPAPFKMKVAESGTVTCRNCDDSVAHSCTKNLLVHDRLTSGYLLGQLYYPKPTAHPHATEGKCSHGGQDDLGKNTAATGGINKETPDWTFSPHAHLHNISGQTAVRATESFFMDATSGFLRDIGQETVVDIFKLNRRHKPSLGFVVDVSASMTNDIRALKQTIISTLSAVKGTANEPGNYVLSTFSDPANRTTVATTKDANELIRWLDNLTVVPENDCPDYVMSGIRAAIKACYPYSIIYIATDGDAKDENMTSIVIQEARAKHISLKFILTGSCLRRYRREIKMQQNSGRSVFDDLATKTGGSSNHLDLRKGGRAHTHPIDIAYSNTAITVGIVIGSAAVVAAIVAGTLVYKVYTGKI